VSGTPGRANGAVIPPAPPPPALANVSPAEASEAVIEAVTGNQFEVMDTHQLIDTTTFVGR
jgi:hypothetical protein